MDTKSRLGSEQGAILVFVAIAVVVLIGFLTFVFDYGILWVSRSEAQTSADSGALSGAIARAYDQAGETDPAVLDAGVTGDSARKAALDNEVWNATTGQQGVQVSYTCPAGVSGNCVRVNVYRNGEFGSSILPIFFGKVLGITTHGVRATATARVAFGNAVNCMRPFSVADKYQDNPTAPWNPAGVFNRWQRKNNDGPGKAGDELPPLVDEYVPPTLTYDDDGEVIDSTGTGFKVPDDVGALVTLKTGNNPNSDTDPISPGWSLPVRLPDGDGGYLSGANDFSNAIKHCIGTPVAINDYLPLENGVMNGPTTQGVETDDDSLIERDRNAKWDDDTNTVIDSCAPGCGDFSPRIVPISVFDLDEYQWRTSNNRWDVDWIPGTADAPGHPGTDDTWRCPVANRCIRVSNIIGFFVEDPPDMGDIRGRVVRYPGEFVVGPSVSQGNSFLVKIQLVR